MTLRLVPYSTSAEVVPLRPVTSGADVTDSSPEPHQLYYLVVLALLLHKPATDWSCQTCEHYWPCEQVRLAHRLREGF